jgi:type IX secretion system PorP/SprF family membrane protein
MKKYFLFLFISFSLSSMAQQDAIYSQYTFNPLVINPAYAGSRNSFSSVLLHRSQWVGIDNAPTSQSFAIHSPMNKSKVALGLNFGFDQLGPTKNVNGGLSAAYHLKLEDSKLSFALRAGFYSATVDKNLLNFKDESDQFNSGGMVGSTVPSLDFGVYYYKPKFYLGLSFNHLTRHEFSFYDGLNTDYYLRTHMFLNGGVVLDISKNVMFKPTALLKLSKQTKANLDLGFNFLFYKKLWLGISFRNKSSVNFMTEFNITDYLRLGYAYDLSINKLSNYNRGSHEIFIGFDFNIKSKKVISPRYI